ncbi:hypothetical protein PHLCEN_2v4525 [Hermanssonia centrifuga]|uniref:Phospholipase D N-terminal domain-containing protein n=1 Tax=Hermanssonia centrifuga TaxID=98765 RepID=A0A2R6PNC0_9APHY|nr:hypothetical protein PHLCEN_2v4525 [Hermanssonia centrifuga]
MRAALLIFFVSALSVQATKYLDRNLAYSSPFVGYSEFSHDTREIQARHIQHAKRQMIDSTGFDDEHYPTFYGGDFSNGDPFDDSILLWTRAVPLGSGPDQSVPVCVSFKIFDNAKLSGKPLDSGEAFSSYDVDFTLKVEAQNLKPDTKYWYRFADCTNPATVSPIGATRTLSSPDSNAKIGRKVLGRELATVFDYRQRLNQYRTDPGLIAAHEAGPWITVWYVNQP